MVRTKKFFSFVALDKDDELDIFLSNIKHDRSEWIREACRLRLITPVDNRRVLQLRITELITEKNRLSTELEAAQSTYREVYGVEALEDIRAEQQAALSAESVAGVDLSNKDQARQDFLRGIKAHAGDRTQGQLREWLSGPGWKDDMKGHGLTIPEVLKYLKEARA